MTKDVTLDKFCYNNINFHLTSQKPSKTLIYQGWRDCVGIEPTRPGTQVSSSFEDCGGHQWLLKTLEK